MMKMRALPDSACVLVLHRGRHRGELASSSPPPSEASTVATPVVELGKRGQDNRNNNRKKVCFSQSSFLLSFKLQKWLFKTVNDTRVNKVRLKSIPVLCLVPLLTLLTIW